MITSFSEFLEALKTREAAILAEEEVKHGPTIGDMYEGLARELLGRAIPPSLNLRLVNGFVQGVDGSFSNQADAMLVMGDAGRQIPKTDKWVFPIADVLAVFEVKKNLYAADLADSIAKMRRISQMQQELLLSKKAQMDVGASIAAFARVMGRFPRAGEMEDLVDPAGEILRTIAHEQLAPVRVVFGYAGYADEFGLRQAFVQALEAVEDGVAGPGVLPNLVICRRNALLKLSGHPFLAPLRENGEWDLIGSTRDAPIALLLELLWTRLSNQFKAQFPVDDSLQKEAVAPLLSGRPVVVDGRRGWYMYVTDLTQEQLAEVGGEQWSPVEVSLEESALIHMSMSRGGLDLESEVLRAAAAEAKIDLKALSDRLVEARLFARESELVAVPIGETIHQVITPDGSFWMSSNFDLLQLWARERQRATEPGPAVASVGVRSHP